MRVLLAEDEKRMAAAIVALLKQEKYDVDHMADGVSALLALESNMYDIAILDVMMPKMNGFEVSRKARSRGITIPILMLTAKSQLAVKIWGFESDAEYNNVEVYMSFTRKKLAFVGSKVEIKAVRGLGYELREQTV